MNRLLKWLVFAACAACQSTHGATGAPALADALTAAHGGMARWSRLCTVSVDREHQGVRTPAGVFLFHIDADFATRRMHQRWSEPAGELGWDGERAWSKDWPMAARLKPRFVMSIGFYLLNLPWLVQDPAVRLGTVSGDGQLPGFPGKRFTVLEIDMEADTVRKPAWFRGPRDHFALYIDPANHRLQGVMQYRTHAGQLEAFGAGDGVDAFVELYEILSYVEHRGLLWPQDYQIYAASGVPTTHGRFFNYAFDEFIDELSFLPPRGDGVVMDDSSSIYRSGPPPVAEVPE